MLSQEQEGRYDQEPEFDDIYVKAYKPTDIFNLAPQPVVYGKRQIVDRNRSSLFKNEEGQAQNMSSSTGNLYKPDRMASDIFFGGNSGPAERFGTYSPSTGISRRSSANKSVAQADVDTSSPVKATNYETYAQEPSFGQDLSFSHSISNVFEAANQSVSLRGARRHYAQHQPASDIFFQNASSESPRKSSVSISDAPYEPKQWVPSVKMTSQSTSFSNIFGGSAEIDSQNRADLPSRSPAKVVDHSEKVSRTFGVSSEAGNRDRRGKGGRRVSGASQIWF